MTDLALGERVCSGSYVHWGKGQLQSAVVLETPAEVRELMGAGEEGVLLEFRNRLLPDVPVFVKASEIIAINPFMSLVHAS